MKTKWFLFTALLSSCQQQADGPAVQETVAPVASATPTAASVSAAPCSAQQALDGLDGRAPVPLLPMMANHQKQNMRDHLLAVQQIVAAAAANDFAAIEKAAERIGFSEQMGQMCEHMGAGAPGFTEAALRFHRDADKVAEAARKRDVHQVLAGLGQTLSHCTSCHETYKQHLVTEPEWVGAARTPPPHPHVD